MATYILYGITILFFIGAWSTIKIPLVLFEISTLGLKFALTRLLIDIRESFLLRLFYRSCFRKPKSKKYI